MRLKRSRSLAELRLSIPCIINYPQRKTVSNHPRIRCTINVTRIGSVITNGLSQSNSCAGRCRVLSPTRHFVIGAIKDGTQYYFTEFSIIFFMIFSGVMHRDEPQI